MKSSPINTKPLASMLLKQSSVMQHEAEEAFHVVTTSLRETGRSSQTVSSSEEELYLMPAFMSSTDILLHFYQDKFNITASLTSGCTVSRVGS